MAASNGLIEHAKPSAKPPVGGTKRSSISWEARRALQLAHSLQTTLEVESLIELFDQETGKDVPHDGLVYRHAEHNLDVELGTRARHKCQYRLLIAGHSLGELELTRRKRFTDAELQLLEYMLSSLLYPLRNALMYRQAVHTALRDPLTGVNNRTAFDTSLKREVDLARRHGTALTMVVLDIDHFKQINDRFGHLVGDYVLRDVAAHAGACIRSTDMLFRYGGEEFVLLLSSTSMQGAKRLAERIRSAIEKMQCRYGSNRVQISASLGVACLQRDDSPQSLFDRADHALLKAKQEGRNRVVFACGSAP